MVTRAQKIRLGIFIIASLVILLMLIGFFTVQRFLKEEDIYYVAYEDVSVSGIEVGSPVKYLGIKVGAIRDISIDPNNVNRIVVKLALKPGTPIKVDAQADITTIGITGLKTIEIRGGSNDAKFLAKDSFIPAGSSLTEDITGKAEVIAEKVEKILNNLQEFTEPANLHKITSMVEKISKTADKANVAFVKIDTMLTENRSDVRTTVLTARQISNRFDSTSILLQQMVTKVNNIVHGDTLNQILGSTRDIAQKLQETNLKGLIEQMSEVVKQTNQLLVNIDRDLDRSSQDFAQSMELLKSTLQNLNEASRMINNDPSVLIRGTKMKETPDRELNKK